MHLNEGHPYSPCWKESGNWSKGGLSFPDALFRVRGTSVFTTHTPLAAGNDIYSPSLMDKYFSGYYPALGSNGRRSSTSAETLATRPRIQHGGMCPQTHGIPQCSLEAARECIPSDVAPLVADCLEENVPIDSITNGVHIPTWLNQRMETLFSTYIDPTCPHWQYEHDNSSLWGMVDEIPDRELWDFTLLKTKSFNRIRERKRLRWASHLKEPIDLVADGLMLNLQYSTIGFARRFPRTSALT